MGNVAISHKKAIIADHGFTLRCSTSIDCNTFAYSGIISDFSGCFFPFEFSEVFEEFLR